MNSPFITFTHAENGLVAHFCRVVAKERPARFMPKSVEDVQALVNRFAPEIIAQCRAAGVLAPDDREDFEKPSALPPPAFGLETYHVLEPVAVFCPDSVACVAAINTATHERSRAIATDAEAPRGVGVPVGVPRAW